MAVSSASSRVFGFISVLLLVTLLTACGSSSSGGASAGVETLLFYTQEDTATGETSLYAVDPAMPEQSMEVHQGLGQQVGTNFPMVRAVVTGAYSDHVLHDAHKGMVVFAGEDGHLYRVSTSPEKPGADDDAPEPVRFSSESVADELCRLTIIPDYAEVEASLVMYSLPDTDNTCGDGTSYATLANMPVSGAPVSVDAFDHDGVFHDPDTGQLRNLVRLNTDPVSYGIEAFDVDSLSWEAVDSFTYNPNASHSLFATDGPGGELLIRQHAISGTTFYLYKPDNEMLDSVSDEAGVDTYAAVSGSSLFAMEHAFFIISSSPSSGLYIASLDEYESAIESSINPADLSGVASPNLMIYGNDHIAWSYQTGTDSDWVLESVSIADQSVNELHVTDGPVSSNVVRADITSAGWFYFAESDNNPAQPETVQAVNVGEGDDSLISLDGEVVGNTWYPREQAPGRQAHRILIYDNGQVMSLDATAPEGEALEHGDFPSDLEPRRSYSFAPAMFVFASRSGGGDDLVMVDTQQADSLVRITDTDDQVYPIVGF